MRIYAALTVAAIVATVSGCSLATHASSGGGASGGSPAASLPGNVTATCKPVWTYDSSNGTPVFGTYTAAYTADAAEMAARYPNPVVPGNNIPGGGNMPYQYPQIKVTTGALADIASVTVVFYDASGTEVNSTVFNVGQTLTAGQTWSQDETTDGLSNQDEATATDGATKVASCQVVHWTSGD